MAIKQGPKRAPAVIKLHRPNHHGGEAEDLEPDDSRTINRLSHEPGAENDSDVLTKALPTEKHWRCCDGLGLVALP